MSFFTPRRVHVHELLDREDIPAADRERSLRDLRRFNRFAGGSRAYRLLLRRLVTPSETFSILDLGTGSSDLLESLPRSGLRVGVDFKIQHLLHGLRNRGESGIRGVAGDAFHLPIRNSGVDVVGQSHLFHHFSPEQNVEVLQEALRVARVGVFVTDTKRHFVPLLFTRALGSLRLVGRVTRHDAPASVRQGYTISEARSIGGRVGARRVELVAIFPFRFGLVLWK